MEKRRREAGNHQRQRNIEVKQRPPAPLVGKPAAQGQADGQRHQCEETPNGQSHRFQPIRIFLQQQGLPKRQGDPAGKTERNARRHEGGDAAVECTKRRRGGIGKEGAHKHARVAITA